MFRRVASLIALFLFAVPLISAQVDEPITIPPTDDGTNIITIPLIEAEIDLNDDDQVRLLAGIALVGASIALILFMILRLIVNGKPAFGNWQAPYANMPPLDPNNLYGRRQAWQNHAQNNVIPAPCRPQTIIARKLLNGMDGHYLSGWRVKALRMTQYDMYGRVARSQVMARRNHIRRINRAIDRLPKSNDKAIQRRVRPVARYLAKHFKKRITRRSAMLAIALDVRFKGEHGEVRIVFELYDCRNGHPHRLDSWEPEMTVFGKAMYESYTFTIFGQHGGETYRDFRKRLTHDVERALSDMLHMATVTPPQPPTAPGYRPPSPPTQPRIEPVALPAPTADESAVRDTQEVKKVADSADVDDDPFLSDDDFNAETQQNPRVDGDN